MQAGRYHKFDTSVIGRMISQPAPASNGLLVSLCRWVWITMEKLPKCRSVDLER
jgi:hypothetical protein